MISLSVASSLIEKLLKLCRDKDDGTDNDDAFRKIPYYYVNVMTAF